MVKKLMLFVIILSLLLNAGCWDMREINDSAVPATIGIDLGGDKQISFSTLFTQPITSEESGSSQIQYIVTTSRDHSVALAARRVMLSLPRVPEFAHVQSVVLGENLVRNGLPLVVDFLIRNRNFPQDTNLLIALQSHPEELLTLVSSTGNGLKQLVTASEFELGTYVPETIGDFIYKLLTPGIEPAVPQVIVEKAPPVMTETTSEDKNEKATNNKTKRIVLHEMAVFKGDKMRGSLNENESRGYRWLNSDTKTGGILVVKSPLQPQEYVALEIAQFKSQTHPQLNNNTIKMHIDLNVQLAFYEETGTRELLTPSMLKKTEQASNLEISRQISSCIRKSQRLNSDILGWGLILQEYQPDTWKRLKVDWNDIYPDIQFEVKVKTKINHSYLTNKAFQIR